MRKLILFSSLLLFGLACSASKDAATSTLSTSAPEATVVLDSLAWTTDLKDAKKIAKAHDLKVLMIFSGSDWCRPCQQFKQEVLTNASFKDATKDKIVVLYLDFPAKKRNKLSEKETAQNASLAEKYNSNGAFPTVLLMSGDEDESPCELKYKGQGPDEWISKIADAIEDCAS